MKTHKYIILAILFIVAFSSCSDDWDSHYSKQETKIDNENVVVSDLTTIEYLKTTAEYSSMAGFFETTGVFSKMDSLDLRYTVFVVANDIFSGTQIVNADFAARGHISSATISPSTLKDGQRIVVWNEKYVNVERTSENSDQIFFNGSYLKKVIKTENGYIYELNSMINIAQSLLQLIEGLDDSRYSIFKNMVLSKNVNEFNKAASTPIGVDNSGNTVYDSVFTVRNPYFLAKGFDLSSESMKATVLIPSNELITNALKEAKEKLSAWNIQRQDSILENWCFQVAFFKKQYTRADFENNIDLPIGFANGQNKSDNVFEKQWRTTINKVDLDNPVELSNGTAYFMTQLKIPQNVMIYRIKGRMNYYKMLTEGDKEKYFSFENFDPATADIKICTDISKTQPWTPYPEGGFPPITDDVMVISMIDYSKNYVDDQGRSLNKGVWEFTPTYFTQHSDGTYDITPMLLPPGEYTFFFGVESAKAKYYLDIYLNDALQGRLQTSTDRANLGAMGGYKMDWYSGAFPEFFPGDSKSKYYDRNGRLLGGPYVVKGDNAVEMRIKMIITELNNTQASLSHWCFMPTANCY